MVGRGIIVGEERKGDGGKKEWQGEGGKKREGVLGGMLGGGEVRGGG